MCSTHLAENIEYTTLHTLHKNLGSYYIDQIYHAIARILLAFSFFLSKTPIDRTE